MDSVDVRPVSRLISCVIVVVLGLQAVAVLVHPGTAGWPFIDYPMYSQSHREGAKIHPSYQVFARSSDGRQVELTPAATAGSWKIFRRFAEAIVRQSREGPTNDQPQMSRPSTHSFLRNTLKSFAFMQDFVESRDTIVATMVAQHEEQLGLEIIELRVESTPVLLTRQGAQRAEHEVIAVLNLLPPPRD